MPEAVAAGTSVVPDAGSAAAALASGIEGTTESTTEFCERADNIAKEIQVTTKIPETILVIVAAKVVAPVAPNTEFEEL